ncbi:MAG: DUF1501 domain-containing protein [Planctomycetes bacterium]|nr:DUF1501 domain-containing protein [Planctomycetota bacterium]
MFDILGSTNRTCDGVSRRNFLRVGSLAVGGLTLPNLLRGEALAKESGTSARRKAVILVWQAGGPSHLDMYDLKPTAPAEYRGEFKPIPTNVPGIEVGEHLPLQAAMFDKFSVVRSAFHTNAGHGMGSQWMLTGYQPTIEVNDNIYPSCGSVVAALRGPNEPGMPAYCNVPNRLDLGKAAYLGASFNPFSPDSNPNDQGFQVRNMKLPGNLSLSRLERRQQLLGQVDTIRRDIDTKGDIVGLDKFYLDAFEMVTNEKALRAFDIHKEDPRLREKYGRNDLGQSCLLARRLVESGVTYVTVQAGGGWDTHGNNFAELKNRLLPQFDRAVAALVDDLFVRGLQEEVLVMAMGEFGRTPRINPQAGRDHWPGAMSVLFAGGGLQMGQAIGTTDSKAEYPTSKPYTPGCVLSTMYHTLGIDHHHVFYDQGRRPLPVLNEGQPIPELVG